MVVKRQFHLPWGPLMRKRLLVLSLFALAACAPEVPDSAAGVGFDDYNDFQAQRYSREQQLAGSVSDPSGTAISDETVAGGVAVPTLTAATAPRDTSGISDEQDFDAVASRETIESDRARLERQAAAYEVIEPTPVPERPRNSGPSVVEFALSTNNAVGQRVYNRSGFNSASRFERNCAKYPSSDLAQEDFLKSGGPQRDGKGLDPDGDGFACYWDPTPFRLAVGNR